VDRSPSRGWGQEYRERQKQRDRGRHRNRDRDMEVEGCSKRQGRREERGAGLLGEPQTGVMEGGGDRQVC
jgi:hypothetical protein